MNVSKVLIAASVLTGSNLTHAQQPNILLIISDDLNTRIGPYMNIDEHTPNLDRLEKQGVKFTKAYCNYPLCGPSRASLMSGLYPQTNGVLRNSDVLGSYRKITPSLANHPSMAGFFRENGYYSARCSKIFHMGVPGGIENGNPGGDDPDSWDYVYNVLGPETQSDGIIELLSPENTHYGSSFCRMILDNALANTQTDYIATSQAIAILESRAGKVIPGATNLVKAKQDKPFFLGVGLVRPHVPLIAPENCFEHYPDNEQELPKVVIGENVPEKALSKQNEKIWKMNEEQQQKTIAAYMASVRFMDQQVGRLLDALDRLGLADNTIVIFISDHGYNLGEHKCWGKGGMWEGETRVPLIISHPKYKANHGTTCQSIVQLIDLYPTLAELCGMADKQPEILQGKSLADYITKKDMPVGDNIAYTVTAGGKAGTVRTNEYKYVRWGADAEMNNEELYDHKTDPEEFVNLVDNKEYKKVLEEMRDLFEKKKKEAALIR